MQNEMMDVDLCNIDQQHDTEEEELMTERTEGRGKPDKKHLTK